MRVSENPYSCIFYAVGFVQRKPLHHDTSKLLKKYSNQEAQKSRVKHYDVIFRIKNSKGFYSVKKMN